LDGDGGKSTRSVLTCNCSVDRRNSEVRNVYGPSEDPTDSTGLRLEKRTPNHTVTIGKPIDNTQIRILSKESDLLPIGIAGEICISGDGVARGYLNQAELTKEKFITDPFNNQSRLYKTGDLGRWLEDGNIEYLGRIDDQVKIRGFRIELGEIEAIDTAEWLSSSKVWFWPNKTKQARNI
jgi:bacitracin synthase 1